MPQEDRFKWFPFDIGAWRRDTAVKLMTHDEKGRYLEFMLDSYDSETPGIHTEDEVRRLLMYSESQWPDHREVFRRAFTILKSKNGYLWVQQRVVAEAKRSLSRREKARKGAFSMHSKKRTYLLEQEPSTCDASAMQWTVDSRQETEDRKTKNLKSKAAAPRVQAVVDQPLVDLLQGEYPDTDVQAVWEKLQNHPKRYKDLRLALRSWVRTASRNGWDRRIVKHTITFGDDDDG